MKPNETTDLVESIDPSDLAQIAYPKTDDTPDDDGKETPPSDDTPDDDGPDEGEPADEGTDEGTSGDEEGSDESEPDPVDPLLKEVKELGLGDYKSVDEFLKGQKELRTRLSQRDDDAAFGRTARELGYGPAAAPAQDSKQTPEGKEKPTGTFRPPHEFNPAWPTLVHAKVDENGAETGEYTGPPDEVRKFLEYDAYEKSYWSDVRRDPSKLVSPEMIDRIVSERLDKATSKRAQDDMEQQADAATKSFLEEHGSFVDGNKEFWSLLDEGMAPERAVEYLMLKSKATEPEKGDAAKEKDLDKARKRKTRRAGSTVSPVTPKRKPPSDMTADELLNSAWNTLTEDERAEVLGRS